jgi:hypothetical protein
LNARSDMNHQGGDTDNPPNASATYNRRVQPHV